LDSDPNPIPTLLAGLFASPVATRASQKLTRSVKTYLSATTAASLASQLYRDSLPVQLTNDVEVLVCAVRALFARTVVDPGLSVLCVKLHKRAHTMVPPAVSTALPHGISTSASSSSSLEEDVYDTTVLRTPLETWLSLRRSLITTLTTIVDIATNLQLFGYDHGDEMFGYDHGDEAPHANSNAQAQTSSFNKFTGANDYSTAPTPTKSGPASSNASASVGTTTATGTGTGAGTDDKAAGAVVGLALTKLVWLLRDVCECSPIVETRPDIVLLCLDAPVGPTSSTSTSTRTSTSTSTSSSNTGGLITTGMARTVVGLYFRLACRLPCGDTALPGMHLEGSHLEDKRVAQNGMFCEYCQYAACPCSVYIYVRGDSQ